MSEIPLLLDEDQLAGRAPLPEPLPVGPRLREVYERRLAVLDSEARTLAALVAAGEGLGLEELAAAAARLGVDAGRLHHLEDAGLVELGNGQLRFVHPLSRSAAYHRASGRKQREVHAALAEVLPPEGDRRAWHLGMATELPDEEMAAVIEQSALRALARSALPEAAAGLERAGRLTPAGPDRGRRLLHAAAAYHATGAGSRTAALLDEAQAYASPELRGRLAFARADLLLWSGDVHGAFDLLTGAADQTAQESPETAAQLLTFAAVTRTMAGDIPTALTVANRAYQLGARGGEPPLLAGAVFALSLVLHGNVPDARSLVAPCVELLSREMSLEPEWWEMLFVTSEVLQLVDEAAAARHLLERGISTARTSGAPGLLPLILALLAEIETRSGDWVRAIAHASEAVDLSSATGRVLELPHALAILARLEACQGASRSCRRHVSQATTLGREQGAGSIDTYAAAVLGLLDLGRGAFERAAEMLDQAAAAAQRHGLEHPAVVPFAGDRVEALVRAGRLEEASEAAARLSEQAERTDHGWAHAAAARARGLVAVKQATAEDELAASAEAHAARDETFDEARALLNLGERRRRAGRRRDARDSLRASYERFAYLGARPWRARARAELRATGERIAAANTRQVTELTPQEVRVALLVAEGASNREAGAALFLSPKTVENYLGRVYAKLGVRSRTQLARILSSRLPVGERARGGSPIATATTTAQPAGRSTLQ